MKNNYGIGIAVAVVSVTVLTGAAIFQDESDSTGMTPEMMRAWAAYSTPGPEHAKLATRAGNWDVTITQWTTPDAGPMVSTGESQMQMIFDGRFLVQEFESIWEGMPFEGLGFSGFNNKTGKFQFTWIDSMATGIMSGEGVFEDNMLTWSGTATDPMLGDYTMHGTETFGNRDRFESVMTRTEPSGNVVKMQFVYVRSSGDHDKHEHHGHDHDRDHDD